MGASKETRDGVAPFVAVIERPMVYVHAYEFISKFSSHIARILKRMLNRFGPMIKAVLDAFGKKITYPLAFGLCNTFVDYIPSQR